MRTLRQGLSILLSACVTVAAAQGTGVPRSASSCEDLAIPVDWSSMQKTALSLRGAYANSQFKQVGATFACLDRSSRRFSGGEAASSAVYWTFRLKRPVIGPPDRLDQLAASWLVEEPISMYAQFAQLRARYDRAWAERGGNFASTTGRSKLDDFYSTLGDLDKRLRATSPQLKNTAIWSNLMLATLLDETQPSMDPVQVFEEGVRRWPTYFDHYEVMLSRLLPRWGGNWPSADAFIKAAAGQHAASEGDTLYARLYDTVFNQKYLPDETGVDKQRFEKSSREWMARFPSAEGLNRIASDACLLENEKLFRDAYDRIPESDVKPVHWNYLAQRAPCVARFKR